MRLVEETMDSIKDFLIIVFFLVAVGLHLWARYRSNKAKTKWKEDFEKFQDGYDQHTTIDDAIKNQNDLFKDKKNDGT